MMKYLLVCNSSYSKYHFFLNIGTTSAKFNALGNVHVSLHLFINDCIGLHRKSAPSLINLPGIKICDGTLPREVEHFKTRCNLVRFGVYFGVYLVYIW